VLHSASQSKLLVFHYLDTKLTI